MSGRHVRLKAGDLTIDNVMLENMVQTTREDGSVAIDGTFDYEQATVTMPYARLHELHTRLASLEEENVQLRVHLSSLIAVALSFWARQEEPC